MNVYTAENDAGDVLFIGAHPEYVRDLFAQDVLGWVKEMDGDQAPHALTLAEWRDAQEAGVWLSGDGEALARLSAEARHRLEIEEPYTWGSLLMARQFARITYEYPGEYVLSPLPAVEARDPA